MQVPAEIRIRVLGRVEIVGADIRLGPKQQLLLGALALRPAGLSTDTLADLLWGDERPDDPRAALQIHVSKLRRPLAEIGASIRYQGDGYALVTDRRHVDVTRFESLVAEGLPELPSNPTRASELLGGALACWSGPPLGGLADDTPLRADVLRLADSRLSAMQGRIEADLATGRHEEVIGDLRQLTREYSYHEVFWRQLMLALYRSGRAGEALVAFDEVRRVLADELGADPGPELQQLHQQILQQDPALSDSPAAVAATERGIASTRDPASVAVLPFEMMGSPDEAALLAVGLHTDLLTELSRIPQLTVISRHSVLKYDAPNASLEQIARELGVVMVLTGSIQAAGRRFRLAVQLIDATAGIQRWAESYDQELSTHNLLAVQQDLASDIAASLSRRLVPTATPTTDSMEAYRLVVEGRMHFDRKTKVGLATAVERFRRAVVVDPSYALAWTGLADALAMTADYGYGDRAALLAGAESAVVRAMALLPETAEIHASLGLIAEGRHDAPGALAEYEKAIRLRPGHADAHSWHAWVSLTLGDCERALASARRSVELNPLSAEAVSNLALSLLALDEPDLALAEAHRSDELSPGYTTAAYYVGLALYDLGRFAESVAVLEPLATALAGELTTPWAGMAPDAALAIAQVAVGDRAAAQATLKTIDVGAYPVETGLVHAALGDTAAAYELFARPIPAGYGAAMLYHHHFRDVWSRLDDRSRLAELGASIARSWHAEPDAPLSASRGA
ncbi:MAG TPA: BTAD domain-containing putative transcriptional regulator [Candidatus Limnocylindria bacterium]